MPLPRFIPPAVPVLRAQPPSGPLWTHEVKFDGWRVQVRREGAGAILLSRNGYDITKRFPAVARAVEQLPGRNFIIDGELVAFDTDGLPSFDDLGKRGSSPWLCAFDILFYARRDLRAQALEDRRRRLTKLLTEASSCVFAPEVFANATELLTGVEQLGLEGIVSKRTDAPYKSGTRCGWIKVKTAAWQEVHRNRQRRFFGRTSEP